MRSLSKIVEQFKQDWTQELSEVKLKAACIDAGYQKWINSVLNPVTTIQIFLLQILHGNIACAALPRITNLAFTDAAYCMARSRIPIAVFQLILKRVLDTIQDTVSSADRWHGHRVFIVDGSSFSMPDTPELQSHFGQPPGQKKGCGFPVSHWMVRLHMATGMITQMLSSPFHTSDISATQQLNGDIGKGDIVVADRAFSSFAHVAILAAKGIHIVARINANTLVDFTPGRPYVVPNKGTGSKRKKIPRSKWVRALGVRDQVVSWIRNKRYNPTWLSAEQVEKLPSEIVVREIQYQVNRRGFRSKEITLVTTLLDDSIYSKIEIQSLYFRRWEIETAFRNIKITLKMDNLKCKTVDGVLKELHMYAIVYNLIQQVMASAAERQNVTTDRISFVDAVRWLSYSQEGQQLAALVVNLRTSNEVQPRVKKRRPKKYKLMNQTRAELKKALT